MQPNGSSSSTSGANDLAAVVYTSGRQESGQELTSSPRLLKAAIDRFQGQKLPSAGAEKLAIHIRQTDTDAALADGPQQTHNREALEKAESIKDPYDAERGLNARRALQAVENVANWMRDVQGRRKALLLFSEGLDYDIYQPFNLTQSASAIVAEAQQAAAAAQRANVNVYGIDPRGLSQFGELIDISARSDYPQLEYGTFRGALHELRLSQESLISLSEETGGSGRRQCGRCRRRPRPGGARQQPVLPPRVLQRFDEVVAQVPEDRRPSQTAWVERARAARLHAARSARHGEGARSRSQSRAPRLPSRPHSASPYRSAISRCACSPLRSRAQARMARCSWLSRSTAAR